MIRSWYLFICAAITLLVIPVCCLADDEAAKEYAVMLDGFDAAIIKKMRFLKGSVELDPQLARDNFVHVATLNQHLEQTRLLNRRFIDLFLLLSVMRDADDRSAVINTVLGVYEEDYRTCTKNAVLAFRTVSNKARWHALKVLSEDMIDNLMLQSATIKSFYDQFQ